MKYKNMSISVIIPVVAAKGEEGVILKPEVKEYSKIIKYDKTWWSDLGRKEFINNDGLNEKITCYELLDNEQNFSLRKELDIYGNISKGFNTYSFYDKNLAGVKFELLNFRLWKSEQEFFIETKLVTDGTEKAIITTEKIHKLVNVIKNQIEKKNCIRFFHNGKINDENIKKKVIYFIDVLDKIKEIFIQNNEKVHFKYNDLFLVNYFVVKKEENILEKDLLTEILKINKVDNKDKKSNENLNKMYTYIKYSNLQHWFINKKSLNLFVEEANEYAGINDGGLYKSVSNNYTLFLIYSFLIKKQAKGIDVLDKWKLYNNDWNFSEYSHANAIFKECLIIALGLDTIDKAVIPLDENIINEPYIFISYSNDDYKQVYPIIVKLKEQGIPVWYDEGLAYGESWENQVKERLNSDNCKGVVFFSSANSFSSKSVIFEIKIVYDMCNKSPCSKDYFAVSLLDTKNFNTTAILRETICKFNNEELGKVWGTEQIKCIIEAFPDENITLSINKEGWFDKMKKTMKDYLDKNN